MGRFGSLAGLLAAFAFPAAASAATITVTFTGEIDFVTPAISSGPFQVGDPISGSFQIDATTPDGEADPDEGSYEGAISNLTFSIGDYDGTGSGENELHMRNGAGFNVDNFFVSSDFTGPDVAGFPPFHFLLNLGDSDNSVFSSDEIPASLDLADFEIANVILGFLDGSNVPSVDGSITSLTYTVPEPGVLALLAFGALVNAQRRRSSRESSEGRDAG
jgi:hypothetical protein